MRNFAGRNFVASNFACANFAGVVVVIVTPTVDHSRGSGGGGSGAMASRWKLRRRHALRPRATLPTLHATLTLTVTRVEDQEGFLAAMLAATE